MKYILYFALGNLAMLILIVKAIFKHFGVFLKALYVYTYLGIAQNEDLDEWEQENDSNHKIHVLYWWLLALLGANIFFYILVI
jgi:hypothetical protein